MAEALAVLIVEDSESDAQMITRVLNKAGYQLVFEQVETAGEMKAALSKHAWDIVISDYSLPQFDGRAALELLKDMGRDIPFILVSGAIGEETAVAMMKSGAHDYLRKGDLARLPPTVARELEQAKDRRERKQAEQALLESKERFEFTIEAAGVGTWDWNIQTGETIFNERWAEIVGYTLEEIAPVSIQTWLNLAHPDDLKESNTLLEKHFNGETGKYQFESRMKHKDGHWVWVLDRGKVLTRDADGKPLRMLGTHTDITERKQIEDTLLFLLQSTYPDENFFQSLARYLAKNLDMDYVCIDRLAGDHLSAQTVAIYFDGKFEDNAAYTLKDTPCGDVVGNTICVFPSRVRHLFPQDEVLQDMLAESYVGTTLWDTQGQPIGLIAVIGRKPLVNRPIAEAVIKLVAVRAAGELERNLAEEALRESESFTQAILKNSPIGISVRSRTGQLLSANDAWKKIWAIPEFDLLKDAMLDRQSLNFNERDDYLKSYKDDVRRVYEQGGNLYLPELKTTHPRPGGAEWVSQHFYAIQDIQGQVARVVILTEDITERKQAEDQVRQLSSAVEHSPASIMITDKVGNIEYVNPKFTELTGYTIEEARYKTPRILKSNRTPPEIYAELWQTILAGKEWRGEFLNRKKNGELYWEYTSISAITDSMGSITHFVAVNEDITARKKAEEKIRLLNAELEQMAVTDYLTNLYNRRYFMKRGDEELKRAKRSKQPLSILMLDIDEFKNINDTYGHETGDFALKQVVATLRSNLRDIDILGRMGGDEFTVLLPNTKIQDAVKLAERVRQDMEQMNFQTPEASFSIAVTISIGAAAFTDKTSNVDDMLRNADAALYQAKRAGRNCVFEHKNNSVKDSDAHSILKSD